MRPCEEIRADLSAYLDGELAPASAAEVERHLADCPHGCREELATLRRVADLVRRLPREAAPPALPSRVDASIAAAGRAARRRAAWAQLAVAATALFAAIWWAFHPPVRPESLIRNGRELARSRGEAHPREVIGEAEIELKKDLMESLGYSVDPAREAESLDALSGNRARKLSERLDAAGPMGAARAEKTSPAIDRYAGIGLREALGEETAEEAPPEGSLAAPPVPAAAAATAAPTSPLAGVGQASQNGAERGRPASAATASRAREAAPERPAAERPAEPTPEPAADSGSGPGARGGRAGVGSGAATDAGPDKDKELQSLAEGEPKPSETADVEVKAKPAPRAPAKPEDEVLTREVVKGELAMGIAVGAPVLAPAPAPAPAEVFVVALPSAEEVVERYRLLLKRSAQKERAKKAFAAPAAPAAASPPPPAARLVVLDLTPAEFERLRTELERTERLVTIVRPDSPETDEERDGVDAAGALARRTARAEDAASREGAQEKLRVRVIILPGDAKP